MSIIYFLQTTETMDLNELGIKVGFVLLAIGGVNLVLSLQQKLVPPPVSGTSNKTTLKSCLISIKMPQSLSSKDAQVNAWHLIWSRDQCGRRRVESCPRPPDGYVSRVDMRLKSCGHKRLEIGQWWEN